MPLKNIAVFVDLTETGVVRTRYAVELALRHGGHLIGIFVAPSGWHDSTESYVRGSEAIRRLIDDHNAREAAAFKAASQSFNAATAREDISFEFRIIRESDADDAKLHSLHADLVIASYPGPGGLPNNWSAESLLLATGVPFLVLPNGWRTGTVAEHVLVAWNASREARRAISDSLPLLATAHSVSVIIVNPAKNLRHGEEPGADIATYLSRHGARVTVEQIESNGLPVADVILNYASRNNIDLIVLGAYSHSQLREIVFGGVTRSLLRDTVVPLLIAH